MIVMRNMLCSLVAVTVFWCAMNGHAQDADAAPADAQPAAEAAGAEGNEGGEENVDEGLGTQGEFLLLVVYDANAEQYFGPTITGQDAARFFARLGLTPDNGWYVEWYLRKKHLVEAYIRLKKTMDERKAALDGLSGASEAEGVDEGEGAKKKPANPEDMTIAELMSNIVKATREALASRENDRMPVSPTGASWMW